VEFSVATLLNRIAADDFELTPGVVALLRDPDAWREQPAEQFITWCRTLRDICRARYEALPVWTAALIVNVATTTNRTKPHTATAL